MGFAKLDEVKEGSILVTDGGFTCMKEGEAKKVERFVTTSVVGGLFIRCNDGKHFLDGQLNSHDEYIGLTLKEEERGKVTSTTT